MTYPISFQNYYLVLWQGLNLLLLYYILKKQGSLFLFSIDCLSQGTFFSFLILEGASYMEVATYLCIDLLLLFVSLYKKKVSHEL